MGLFNRHKTEVPPATEWERPASEAPKTGFNWRQAGPHVGVVVVMLLAVIFGTLWLTNGSDKKPAPAKPQKPTTAQPPKQPAKPDTPSAPQKPAAPAEPQQKPPTSGQPAQSQPVTTAPADTQLSNTGPGDTLAIFAIVTVVGAVGYQTILRRDLDS